MADLTDAQWEYVRLFVEWDQEVRQRPDGRGGRWGDARPVLNGVLWILRTGAPWQDLPPRYGSHQTCHRRFQQWQRSGVLDGILWALCEDLLARGELGLEEAFVDATFAGAKRGAIKLVQHAAAKGARSWQSRTAMVFLSPSGLRALHRMSQRSSKTHLRNDSRWQTTPALHPPLENRTTLRLAEKLPQAQLALGAIRNQLPRYGPTRMLVDPLEASMRLLLGPFFLSWFAATTSLGVVDLGAL